MDTIKIKDRVLGYMLKDYDEEWYDNIFVLINATDDEFNSAKMIFPLVMAFDGGNETLKALLKYYTRNRDISDIVRDVSRFERDKHFAENVRAILTFTDCDVALGLQIFIKLYIWNKGIFEIAERIREYPMEDRKKVLDFVDWLYYHNVSYSADFQKMFELIRCIEITDIVKDKDWFGHWLNEED